MKRFIPRKRTAIDGAIWWCVYDNAKHEFSKLLCFGKYKRRKDCQQDIDYYSKHPFWSTEIKKEL